MARTLCARQALRVGLIELSEPQLRRRPFEGHEYKLPPVGRQRKGTGIIRRRGNDVQPKRLKTRRSATSRGPRQSDGNDDGGEYDEACADGDALCQRPPGGRSV